MSDPVQSAKNPRRVITWPEAGVEMAFRLIPSGSFRMGSRGHFPEEEPVHRVKIPEPFWMAETSVTQAQFALWTKAEGIDHKNHFEGHADHPAENLDWRQAVAYCAWLTRTKAAEFPNGFTLACLPTEAEWEYACRAGTETEYYTGDGEAALAEAGWYSAGEWGSLGSTQPVRQKAPDDFGLHDLLGNVWEWCHDVWGKAAYWRCVDGADDPGRRARAEDYRAGEVIREKDARFRVLRGGSWFLPAVGCRSACRDWRRPDVRFELIGLRICLVRGSARTVVAERRSPKGEA
jgi:formylglycine-generating enzyme required for sulfatase activity